MPTNVESEWAKFHIYISRAFAHIAEVASSLKQKGPYGEGERGQFHLGVERHGEAYALRLDVAKEEQGRL